MLCVSAFSLKNNKKKVQIKYFSRHDSTAFVSQVDIGVLTITLYKHLLGIYDIVLQLNTVKN